jgi:hypothetical protein
MAKEKKSKIKLEGRGLVGLTELIGYLKGVSDKPLTIQIVDPDAEEPITFTWEVDDKIGKTDIKLPKELEDKAKEAAKEAEKEPEDKEPENEEPKDEPENDEPVNDDDALIMPEPNNEEPEPVSEEVIKKQTALIESFCHAADELI